MKITEIQIKGYKNLIDCTIPLGNFNVIIGPNNSGKSNFMEFFQFMGDFSILPDEKEKKKLFQGKLVNEEGSSIPHGKQYAQLPLTLGVSFETPMDNENWQFHYEVTINRNQNEKKGKFSRELLTGKRIGTPGVEQNFFQREDSCLKITKHKKESRVPDKTASFSAIQILYPEPKKLPVQIPRACYHLIHMCLAPIYALSPAFLRHFINETLGETAFRFSAIGILETIDKLKAKEDLYSLFVEKACDILDLDDLHFEVTDIKPPPKSKSEKKPERLLQCFIKRPGGDYVNISECSDGTLMVLAILAGVLSDEKHPLICIEEPENYLHPAALSKLIDFLKEQSANKQILLTTHSPYLLNSVRPEDVIVALPDKNAATVFNKPKDIKKIHKLLKSGFFSLGDLLVDNFAEVL